MHVLIAGGGVAALETLLALRDMAEDRLDVELLAPKPEFSYRPLAIAEPFGLGETRRYDLAGIAQEQGAAVHIGTLAAVESDRHRVRSGQGGELDYDLLVVAVGAKNVPSLGGAVTVLGPGYTGRFRTILKQLEEHRICRVTFAVPPGVTWPLPLYELALMTAGYVAEHLLERSRDRVELRLVTPESAPLELFGAKASAAVSALLEERGISVHTGLYPSRVEDGSLTVIPAEHPPVPADKVVTLPSLRGPRLSGLPHDADGFIPVDLHGLVQGEQDVYAAGDATAFPIKQGGIACQQADAVAEAIAARVGAPVSPQPFHPVLRGLLLTGATPRYMRAEVGGGRGEDWQLSDHALWWPPSKIAGRYLSPYLGVHHDQLETRGGVPIEVELEAHPAPRFTHRAILTQEGGLVTPEA